MFPLFLIFITKYFNITIILKMQSERKKLGQFNQIPMSDIKSANDIKYK